MKTRTFGLFIFLLTLMWRTDGIYGEIPGKESDALRTLFDDTGGRSWRRTENWKKAPGTEHTWYGITCNADNTTVLKIELPNNNLQGKLPADLEALSNLTTLDLSKNKLTGTIPMWIEKLKNLKKLDLSSNYFEGEIPTWIGNLKNLEELILDDNMLEGIIPETLGSLSKLRVLRLGSNRLTGEIPAELGRLTDLINNQSDFAFNGLYTQNVGLKKFFQQKQVGRNWEITQTTALDPQYIKVVDFKEHTITISWKPITYTVDTGGYRIFYREEGQPYDDKSVVTTTNKTATEAVLKELKKGTKYYFKIRTWTDRHSKNRNRIESKFTKEFSTATRGIIISGNITRYIDMQHSESEALPGVQVRASNMGGEAETDNDGKYRLNVIPGWIGTITPAKDGFDFSPPYREYPRVEADISDQDFTSAANTAISGRVTYKGKGIAGVEIAFENKTGKTFLDRKITDSNGHYEQIVPYNWAGTVTPKKEKHQFDPEKIPVEKVTSHLEDQNFSVNFPEISGRVTHRRGKIGIPGVKLIFSNVETEQINYLKDHTITDSVGNYRNDIPYNWTGNVTPISPQKTKYLFYPSVRQILTPRDTGRAVAFKAETDFKVFILLSGSYMLHAENRFNNIYGSGIASPEIIVGFKLTRYFYVWSGYGFFSTRGKSPVLEEPCRWRQRHLNLGLGYYNNISLALGWKVRVGAALVKYTEEGFGEEVSDRAFGVRIEGAGVFKINSRLFTELFMGYLFASDTIEEIAIKLGGLRAGISLGLRF
jgi:hypothetical protein